MPALMTGQTAVFTIDAGENELIWPASIKLSSLAPLETLIGNNGHNMMTELAGIDQHLLPSLPFNQSF